jgi:glucose/arabinose dehydrogenase
MSPLRLMNSAPLDLRKRSAIALTIAVCNCAGVTQQSQACGLTSRCITSKIRRADGGATAAREWGVQESGWRRRRFITPQPAKSHLEESMTLRMRSVPFTVVLGMFGVLAVTPVSADPSTIFAPIAPLSGVPLKLKLVADGLVAPLKGKIAPGEPGRFYVVNQSGELTAVDIGTGAKTLFLDLRSRIVPVGILGPGSFDERGFLGVAFHPDYCRNGKFYTYTSEPVSGVPPTFPTTLPAGTAPNHQNVVAEWKANNPGHPASGATFVKELIRVDWPQFNHNAGDITFGPDEMLYIPTGDGGGADDQDGDTSINPPPGVVGHQGDGNGQKLNTVLGKILRIDVEGHNSANHKYGIPRDNPFVRTKGALGEIWAYGIRNAYRMSFDTGTGLLIAGDVGQNDIEEVDVIVKGGNYGWPLKEGTKCFNPAGTDTAPIEGFATDGPCPHALPPGLIDPIAQYDTDTEGVSVIGGFVYRGKNFDALKGRYVFGDFTRIFNFPNGPDNYGRLFYLQQTKLTGPGLRTIKEFKNVAEEAVRLGLTDPARPPAEFPQSIAVMGWAQDDKGEIYVLGSRTGRAVGTGGFILKLKPADDND